MKQSRMKRISVLLQRLISTIIQKELQDPRLKPFLSISRVDVSKDLSSAKVFVSMLNTEEVHQEAVDALNHAAGFIRKELFKNVEFKTVPQLKFYVDHSIAEGQILFNLIEQSSK